MKEQLSIERFSLLFFLPLEYLWMKHMLSRFYNRTTYFLMISVAWLSLSAFILPTTPTPTKTMTNTEITNYKMKVIEDAMHRYARSHFRLPCPSLSNLDPSNANFGKEYWPNTTPSTCGFDPDYQAFISGANFVAGSVPTRTLGLPDDYMLDGWGRHFRYVIDQAFANKGEVSDALDAPDSTYSYTIKAPLTIGIDPSNNRLLPYIKNYYQFVGILISYGENGYGAVTKDGVQLSASNDLNERSHHEPAYGGTFDATFKLIPQDTTYDDITYPVSRINIIGTKDDVFCPGSGTTPETNGYTPEGPGYPAYYWRYVVADPTGTNLTTKPCYEGYINDSGTGSGSISRICSRLQYTTMWGDLRHDCTCPTDTATTGPGFSEVDWNMTQPAGGYKAISCSSAHFDIQDPPYIALYPENCTIFPNSPGHENPAQTCGTPGSDPNFSGKYENEVSRLCTSTAQVWEKPDSSGCTCTTQTITDGNVSYSGTWPAGHHIGDQITLTEATDNVCITAASGEVTAECSPVGGWLVIKNTCDPAICPAYHNGSTQTDWPDRPVRTPIVLGSCAAGLVPIYNQAGKYIEGYTMQSCNADGTWAGNINHSCGCPKTLMEKPGYKYLLPTYPIPAGMWMGPFPCNQPPPKGSAWASSGVRFQCTGSGWQTDLPLGCTQACPDDTNNNAYASFPNSAPGTSNVVGTCHPGLEVKTSPGVVTRDCRPAATWAEPYGACVCPAPFSGIGFNYPKLGQAYVGTVRHVACNTGGLVGSVTIECKDNIGWEVTGGSCN